MDRRQYLGLLAAVASLPLGLSAYARELAPPRQLAAWRQLSLAEVQASYAGMALPGLTGNCQFFSDDSRLLAAAAKFNALMMASGLLAAADDLSELVTDRYLPRKGSS